MLFLAAHPRGSVMTPWPPKKDQRVSTVSDATESGPLDYLSQSPRVPILPIVDSGRDRDSLTDGRVQVSKSARR